MRTVAVVGASLAGLSAARSLRKQGFDGRLVVIGDEPHRPYDRPPLSKEFLAGDLGEADLALEADDEDLRAEWLLGVRATGLDRDRGVRPARRRHGRSGPTASSSRPAPPPAACPAPRAWPASTSCAPWTTPAPCGTNWPGADGWW